MNFLRLLFPNWRFFENIGHSYTVLLQIKGQENWVDLIPEQNPSWLQLVWNPEGNFFHAIRSCAEQLTLKLKNIPANEIEAIPQFITLYKFAQSMVQDTDKSWRFKIVATYNKKGEDILLTPWYETK